MQRDRILVGTLTITTRTQHRCVLVIALWWTLWNASCCCQAEDLPAAERIATELPIERIEQLVENLGSPSFAKRERASNALMAYGTDAAIPIQRVLEKVSDPEAADRGQRIVDRLVGEDNLKKIRAFLRGENIHFKGWRTFRNLMGDNLSVRELFVEVRRSQPDLTKLLDRGTPREISIATAKMVDALNKRILARMRMLDRADVVALFLPAVDPRVPLAPAHERMLFRMLDQSGVATFRKDATLKTPFRNLVKEFLDRSSDEYRFEALLQGISWEIEATKDIAIQTLIEAAKQISEKDQPVAIDSVTIAMRAICRFGTSADAATVELFLTDSRPAADDAFRNNRIYRIQVADVAMATIAHLHELPLQEFGFTDVALLSPRLFYPSDLGFPADQPEKREINRKKLMRRVQALRAAKLEKAKQN